MILLTALYSRVKLFTFLVLISSVLGFWWNILNLFATLAGYGMGRQFRYRVILVVSKLLAFLIRANWRLLIPKGNLHLANHLSIIVPCIPFCARMLRFPPVQAELLGIQAQVVYQPVSRTIIGIQTQIVANLKSNSATLIYGHQFIITIYTKDIFILFNLVTGEK
jgi:hypothetical protein